MVISDAPRIQIEAAPEEVGISSARLQQLTDVMKRHVEARDIPGFATLAGRHGKVVHFATHGSMDDEAHKPLTENTIYRIYSMTKPIASVGLMMLFEENRFALDEPAAKYIPELADLRVFAGGTATSYHARKPARQPSIRDMLTHCCGFGPFGPSPVPSVLSDIYREHGISGMPLSGTLAEQMVRLGQVPLEVDPGANFIYSVGTDVVARLCEVFSGQSFDRFLRDRILDPLGMVDTSFYVPAAKKDRLAANYRPTGAGLTFRAGGGYELFDPPATSNFARQDGTYFSGVGGLCSTIHDYMRFAKMLANRGTLDGVRIIGPRTLELMTLNHLPGGVDLNTAALRPVGSATQHPGTGFGLGFAVLQDPAAAQVLGSAGEYYWSGAASTHFFVSPRDGLFAIFMTQLLGAQGAPFGRELRTSVYQALTD
ncbi:MAG TPA: serine hydrolase domain-containing protein [Dehalococcoidia bacterium]